MQSPFRKIDDFLEETNPEDEDKSDLQKIKKYCKETFGKVFGDSVYDFIREPLVDRYSNKFTPSKRRLLFLQDMINTYGGLRVVKGFSDCYKIIRKQRIYLKEIKLSFVEGVIKNNYKNAEPEDVEWPLFVGIKELAAFKKQVAKFEELRNIYEGAAFVTPVSQEPEEDTLEVNVVIPEKLEPNGRNKSEDYQNYRYRCTCGWEMDSPTITCKSCKAIFRWGGYK